ncbi:MAG TPA: DNA mismatch repair protein MutS [Lacibacter sp.]|nr:DNA mismatch repair protein MutS [Lacibacter sp.]HMO87934.1 DNA mismatch repair protein MutS [Lacibacter sp.]HMP87092.1 DNA mismatch repair protein MutS [Lacibacter sp.]
MELDKLTYYDLSILSSEEEYSLLHRINFCHSHGGREQLQHLLTHPHKTVEQVQETQQVLRQLLEVLDEWPLQITNGTLQVVQKYYEYPFNRIPHHNDPLAAYTFRWLNNPDYTLIRFSVVHSIDFIKGMHQLELLLARREESVRLQHLRTVIRSCLRGSVPEEIIATPKAKLLAPARMLRLGHYLRFSFKQQAQELLDCYHQLDAWYSMAMAVRKYNLHFPELMDSSEPVIRAEGLYHLLLEHPVAYDVTLDPHTNFLFLTGANMAGKSTFIKSVGCAVYLAHVGMGVPAARMQLSLFNGLLSNIQVQDNIVKGESYFFNEVQRIKNTVLKINDGRKWLVLIDELFKGTNIQDAMVCSTTVIKGLLRIKNSLFILSTHLYEIGEELNVYPNIAFRYFETTADNEQLQFSYQLKEGISSDRFGYLILKREKVVELLQQLGDDPTGERK